MFGSVALLGTSTMDLGIEGLWNQDLTSVGALVASGGAIYLSAMAILSVILLYGIYDAFMHGGGMREVAVLMVKVSVCAFLIQNWQSFFNDLTTNGSFMIANHINSQNFYQDLYNNYITKYVQAAHGKYSFFHDVIAGPLVLAQNLMFAIATALFWVGYYFIAVVFTMFGLVLFAVGPLVIALFPNSIFGSMAKSYLNGVLQWLTWPIIYSIIGLIMNQLFATDFSLTAPLGSGTSSSVTFGGVITNVAVMAVLGISMFTVPWIAHHVVSGSFAGVSAVVGSAVGSVVGAGVGAVAGGVGALSMAGAGGAATAGGGGGTSAAGSGGAASAAGGGGGAAGSSGGASAGPPRGTPPPSQSGGGAQPSGAINLGPSGASTSPPAVSPQAAPASTSSGSGGGSAAASPSAPSPSPGSSTGGKTSGSHWNWSQAVAGGITGYRQGVGGVAGTWARNKLRPPRNMP